MAAKNNDPKIKIDLPPLPKNATEEQRLERSKLYDKLYNHEWWKLRCQDPAFKRKRVLNTQRHYRRRKAEDPNYVKKISRKLSCRAAGISEEEYARLDAAQQGLCAICGENRGISLSIDHDHATGEIRALLCKPCNLGLGNFGDSSSNLWRAFQYLITHQRKQEAS